MPDIKKASDDELVLRLRRGSHRAFEEIYNRYKLSLIDHAYSKLGIYEDAKEIVQDVFTTIWSNHTKTPVLHNLAGWLYILVRNKVLNHIAHERVVSRYMTSFRDFVQQDNHVADLILQEKEMKLLIDREIDNLPSKMRRVLLMSREDHLSNKVIAQELQISENTVKNHLKAALKILRKRLGSVLTLIV